MALNMFKKYSENLTREWKVASGTLAGALVVDANSGQVGVTLTARGDTTATKTLPDGSSITYAIGGAGNKPNCATVAVDGTWLFPVTGVTAGDTNAATGGGTARGTKVYRVAADGTLTLTATSNTLVGIVDDGYIVGTSTPFQIGAL